MFHLLRLVLDSIDKVPLVAGFVWASDSRHFAYPFTCRLFDFDSFDSLLFRIHNFQFSLNSLSSNILITGVIYAKQQRDVMTLDVPNAYVQTPIPQTGDKIIMKIRGSLVDILIEICPGIYDEYVVEEGKQDILYVRMLMALYGMLIASILWYNKF
jgi:hypothetical protein